LPARSRLVPLGANARLTQTPLNLRGGVADLVA
jgi:hypothetical protein